MTVAWQTVCKRVANCGKFVRILDGPLAVDSSGSAGGSDDSIAVCPMQTAQCRRLQEHSWSRLFVKADTRSACPAQPSTTTWSTVIARRRTACPSTSFHPKGRKLFADLLALTMRAEHCVWHACAAHPVFKKCSALCTDIFVQWHLHTPCL